jgi:5-deoxy-glucuronate isomerase
MTQWFYPRGSLRQGPWETVVDSSLPGWKYTGMRLADSSDAKEFSLEALGIERVIYVLRGDGATVSYSLPGSSDSTTVELAGRQSVFHGGADYLYLPPGTSATIEPRGRVMVVEAPTEGDKPVQFRPAADVPLTLRGHGRSTRQIHDFGGVDYLDANRMVAVEVLVPAGNWSGIPQHKHDTYIPGVESNLEEIYYFEVAPDRAYPAPETCDPIGYFRAYSSDDRSINELLEVRSGDVALVPYGFHGPAGALPGYDLYFMNVMAGPDPERAWNIADDPNHAWIRETWAAEEQDPRLPYLA